VGINRPGKVNVPPSDNPFGLPSLKRQALARLQPVLTSPDAVSTLMGDEGLPIFFKGKTAASAATADAALATEQAPLYLASLRPPGIKDVAQFFL